MLQVENVHKIFMSGDTKVAAVDGISFQVNEGDLAAIVGQSGSGKTTLLSLLGALDKPTDGAIIVDNQDITELSEHALIAYRGKRIGFIFQGYNLVPNLSAIENVILPMEAVRVPKRLRKIRARELLERVGLTGDKQRRKPGRLSGGEQQRVAIARALANNPKLILADEPTGNLDSKNGALIFNLLRDLSRTERTTIVVVTHDENIARQTDVIFRLQDGRLKEVL
jgi:putative ABC transport system ATP-binding protein